MYSRLFTFVTLVYLCVCFVVASGLKENHRLQHVMAAGKSVNVLKGPLAFFSNAPVTGYLRNGRCEVPESDTGNHSVAAEVTAEFLDYSAKQGNDLRGILTPGCKWCLCASRWKEAFDARKSDDDKVVPKVFLSATNEKALDKVKLEDLKKFAAQE